MGRVRAVRGLVVGIGAAALLGAWSWPFQAAQSSSLSPRQVFEMARAATVLIQVNIRATSTLPALVVSDASVQVIRSKLQAELDSGLHNELRNDATWVKAYDTELFDHPEQYFSLSSYLYNEEEQLVVQGTGFVVSPGGYIVTSARVAAPPDADILAQFRAGILSDVRLGRSKVFVPDVSGMTPSQAQRFAALFDTNLRNHLVVNGLTTDIHVAFGKGTPGAQLEVNGLRAHVANNGDPIPGMDVAILHVDSLEQLPSLPLGAESSLKVGDSITTVGFPGDTIFPNQDATASVIEPTMTTGRYTGPGPKETGYSTIGTDATASYARSGGPMLDARGNVVGVMAFAGVGDGSQPLPRGSFAVPISIAKNYLAKSGIAPTESQTEIAFAAALRELDAKHFKAALPMLQSVKATSKANTFVDAYISDAEKAIVENRDETPPSPEELAPWAGGGLVLLVILVLGALLARRRRRSQRALLAELAAARAAAPKRRSTPPGKGE